MKKQSHWIRYGKEILTFILSACLVAVLAQSLACTNRSPNLAESWKGRDYQDAIIMFGPPERILNNPDGSKILYFSSYRAYYGLNQTDVFPGYVKPNQAEDGSVGHPQVQGYRVYWVDANGIITKWQWRFPPESSN